MQIRLVYSSFTHTQTYDSGDALLGESDINDRPLPSHAYAFPLYTPSGVITSVSGTDAQLGEILSALGPYPYSKVSLDSEMAFGPGLIGMGLMPDGNQFIELDLSVFVDRVFDDWQWYIDNDPTSTDLPVGFSPAWMARRADVHAFKSIAANDVIRIQTGKHDLMGGQRNATITTSPEGLRYTYGLPSIVEAWVYDKGTGALLASDANMTLVSIPNPEPYGPSDFDVYDFLLSGGAPQQFWTNFKACVEDV